MITTADYMAIAKAIFRAAHHEMGRTARDNAFADLADDIADILAHDAQFQRGRFMAVCNIPTPPL